jgi:hypothetical protein
MVGGVGAPLVEAVGAVAALTTADVTKAEMAAGLAAVTSAGAVTMAGAVTTEAGPAVDPGHLHGEVGEVHGQARHVGAPLVASQSVWFVDCVYASLVYGQKDHIPPA